MATVQRNARRVGENPTPRPLVIFDGAEYVTATEAAETLYQAGAMSVLAVQKALRAAVDHGRVRYIRQHPRLGYYHRADVLAEAERLTEG